PDVGAGHRLDDLSQADHLEAVGFEVVVQAPALRAEAELLAKRLDVGHRVGHVEDLRAEDRALRALAAHRAVVRGDERGAMAHGLAAVVGLVPDRERLDPWVALAQRPELELQALGSRERAPVRARVPDRDERLDVQRPGRPEPRVELLDLPRAR